MAPARSSQVILHEIDVDLGTRWWSDYPTGKFSTLAKPQRFLESYMEDVFARPKRLARSASATSLTYIREADPCPMPIRRTPSVSDLSPSHVLPYYDRVPQRFISSVKPIRQESGTWFTSSYAPHLFRETHKSVAAPTRQSPWPRPAYVSYYSNRVFGTVPRTPPSMKSYLRGTERYMADHVSSRFRFWDKALPHIHNSYDYHKPSSHRFNRHMMWSSGVFVSAPVGNPKIYGSFAPWNNYRHYRLTDRLLF